MSTSLANADIDLTLTTKVTMTSKDTKPKKCLTFDIFVIFVV
jgi:hypothetical protein